MPLTFLHSDVHVTHMQPERVIEEAQFLYTIQKYDTIGIHRLCTINVRYLPTYLIVKLTAFVALHPSIHPSTYSSTYSSICPSMRYKQFFFLYIRTVCILKMIEQYRMYVYICKYTASRSKIDVIGRSLIYLCAVACRFLRGKMKMVTGQRPAFIFFSELIPT